jgi:hypothetical protein
MLDHNEFDDNLTAISRLHGELIHELFESVYQSEEEDDFEKIGLALREILEGLSATYSSIANLIRYADERQMDQEMKFIFSVRKTINDLPLYEEPAKKVGCPSCLGGRRKLTGTCKACKGAGTLPSLPRSRAEG